MSTKVSELTRVPKYGHFVFVGKSGTGKTAGAASWPKPYIFDFDAGLTSLASARDAGLQSEAEFDTYTEMNPLQMKLRDFEKTCPYETLIFDSTTVLSSVILRYFARVNNHLDAFGQPVMGEKGGIGILEYGQRIGWLTGFLISLSRFPINTIVICHEETIKDDILGNILTRASVPGQQLPDQVPAFFDEVWRFELVRDVKGNPEVRVNTVAESVRYTCKSRMNLKNMTFKFGESLYSKVLEQLKGGAPALPK